MTTRTIPRMKSEERIAKLQQAVNSAPGNHFCNIIVAQVDPDAIGAAYGIAEILQILGKETAIWFSGGFSHPQNRVIKHRFNLGAEMAHIGKFTPQLDTSGHAHKSNYADVAVRNNNIVLVKNII